MSSASGPAWREMSERAARISGNAAAAPLPPGQSRFYVSTIGMPGQERVLSVAREEYFVEGTLPTVDAVRGALVAKYGEPSQELDQSGLVQLWWMYDTSGRKFADGACQIGVSPDAGTSLSTGCGISVGARIQRSQTNAGLAQSLAVSAQDGARGYEVLQQTEAALRVGDAQRKARELENASKNATAPKL